MSSPISEAEVSSLKQDVKTGKPVLTIRDMHISYFPRGKEVKAVRGVDLTVHAGETLALVGESGSGKSSVAFASMRGLDAAGRIMKGSINFHDSDVLSLNSRELKQIQGSRIAMVYQDPQTALNPAYRIGDQIAEAVNEHTNMQPQEVRERVLDLLEEVNFLIQLASMRDIPMNYLVDNSNAW